MSKRTPSPWRYLGRVTTGHDTVEWPTVEVAPKRYIKPEGRSFEEAEANARLIAAAPEMYDLISDLSQAYDDNQSSHELASRLYDLRCVALRLLDKIEGGGDNG